MDLGQAYLIVIEDIKKNIKLIENFYCGNQNTLHEAVDVLLLEKFDDKKPEKFTDEWIEQAQEIDEAITKGKVNELINYGKEEMGRMMAIMTYIEDRISYIDEDDEEEIS